MKINNLLAVAGTLFAACVFAAPASAIVYTSSSGTEYLLETTANFDAEFGAGNHSLSQDMLFTTSPAQAIPVAEAENNGLTIDGSLAFGSVQAIGKLDVEGSIFSSCDTTGTNACNNQRCSRGCPFRRGARILCRD